MRISLGLEVVDNNGRAEGDSYCLGIENRGKGVNYFVGWSRNRADGGLVGKNIAGIHGVLS